MPGTFTIGELAAAAGVPASTVRFYEREGLLAPDGRTEARYRVYGGRSLARLRFIRAAQQAGLALRDVRTLLALRERGATPCGSVRQLLEARLAATEQRLTDLRRVRGVLRSSLATCRERGALEACGAVERLESSIDPGRPARASRTSRRKPQP